MCWILLHMTQLPSQKLCISAHPAARKISVSSYLKGTFNNKTVQFEITQLPSTDRDKACLIQPTAVKTGRRQNIEVSKHSQSHRTTAHPKGWFLTPSQLPGAAEMFLIWMRAMGRARPTQKSSEVIFSQAVCQVPIGFVGAPVGSL